MGQHQEILAGSSVLRRIILLLAVAAVIAAMVVATAAPADARVSGRQCVSLVTPQVSGADTADALKEICGTGHPRI